METNLGDLIAGLLGLTGVIVGAAVTGRAADRKWIRELKVNRYNDLMHVINEGNDALLEYVAVLSAPEKQEKYEDFVGAIERDGGRLVKAVEALQLRSTELSVYASRGVAQRTLHVLGVWRSVNVDVRAMARQMMSDAASTADSDAVEPEWPLPEIQSFAARIQDRYGGLDRLLTARRRQLTQRIRVDLGVDRVWPWRRLTWWRADRAPVPGMNTD